MSARVISTTTELDELANGAAIKSLLGGKPTGRTWGKVEGEWWGIALYGPETPELPALLIHEPEGSSVGAAGKPCGCITGESCHWCKQQESDPINPDHYRQYPHEVIEFTEHMNFCRGNAVKYIARAGAKDPAKEIEDLEKAAWYIQREIKRLRGEA